MGRRTLQSAAAFTIYDTFDRWSHAKTNDTGFIAWDVDREVFAVVWLSTPMTRRGTLAAALGRDENKDMTDADDSSTVSVNGYFVPTGKKIPSGSRVKADYNVLAKKWYVDTTDVLRGAGMMWCFLLIGMLTLGGYCPAAAARIAPMGPKQRRCKSTSAVSRRTKIRRRAARRWNASYILTIDPTNPCQFSITEVDGPCATTDCSACVCGVPAAASCDSNDVICDPNNAGSYCNESGTVTRDASCDVCESTEGGTVTFPAGSQSSVCTCPCQDSGLVWGPTSIRPGTISRSSASRFINAPALQSLAAAISRRVRFHLRRRFQPVRRVFG